MNRRERRRHQRGSDEDTVDAALMRGEYIDMLRIEVSWERERGITVRYSGVFSPDLPFIMELCRTVREQVDEERAELASVFAVMTAILPSGRFDLFSVHYVCKMKDNGTPYWRTALGIAPIVAAMFNGRIFELAGSICNETLKPVVDGADAHAEAVVAGEATI